MFGFDKASTAGGFAAGVGGAARSAHEPADLWEVRDIHLSHRRAP